MKPRLQKKGGGGTGLGGEELTEKEALLEEQIFPCSKAMKTNHF